jgi:hypothetical protein
MDLAARGKKRRCLECGDQFYDLMRDPAPCPSCGHLNPLEAFIEGKRPPAAEPKVTKKDRKTEVEDDLDLDDDDLLDDDDDDVVLDDDEEDDDEDPEFSRVSVSGDDEED